MMSRHPEVEFVCHLARELIEAFLWHWRHDSLPKTASLPGYGKVPIKFAEWPSDGFDEWFQLAALYPRFAKAGILSFIPSRHGHNSFRSISNTSPRRIPTRSWSISSPSALSVVKIFHKHPLEIRGNSCRFVVGN